MFSLIAFKLVQFARRCYQEAFGDSVHESNESGYPLFTWKASYLSLKCVYHPAHVIN